MTNRSNAGRERGVTLIEMMVVTLLIALLAGISFPALSAGLESLRISGAARSVSALINAGLNRAESRQEAVEFVISPAENRIQARSTDVKFRRELKIPDGVAIAGVLPPLEEPGNGSRSFFLYPGGAVPAIGVVLKNRRGDVRIVSVDPITGVPSVEAPPRPEDEK